MALKLKEGITIADKQGNKYGDVYGTIKDIVSNSDNKTVYFNLKIFKDKLSKTEGFDPIEVIRIACDKSALFDKYFSIEELSKEGTNEFMQSYIYALNEYKDEDGELILKDYISD